MSKPYKTCNNCNAPKPEYRMRVRMCRSCGEHPAWTKHVETAEQAATREALRARAEATLQWLLETK